MRRLAVLPCLLLIAAAPPPRSGQPLTPDQKLDVIIGKVSAKVLRGHVEGLVSFGTRHTLSSTTDKKRGIGAAMDWAYDRVRSLTRANCNHCLVFQSPYAETTGPRIPRLTRVKNVVFIQNGTQGIKDVVIIQAHIDSRVTDVMNFTSDAPGANDNASGSAAVIEAARILTQYRFPHTIVYALLSGEEQGLVGGKVLADFAKEQGWNVIAVLNNDIIGNSCGSDGVCDADHVRVLSEGPRVQGQSSLAASMHSYGGENDSPSRNLSRYLDSLAGRVNAGLDVRPIWRTDRFGRGGDHIPFLDAGFPAARISVAVENYDYQHQDLRTENGIQYGDTVDKMDFEYLAKVTKLNVAALASLASAPLPPEPVVDGAVKPDTTISWPPVRGAASYMVRWRRTDASNWEHERKFVPQPSPNPTASASEPRQLTFQVVLPHIRVDDWIFGVSSVSADGFESPVASAVPGGAFKPYVAPPKP